MNIFLNISVMSLISALTAAKNPLPAWVIQLSSKSHYQLFSQFQISTLYLCNWQNLLPNEQKISPGWTMMKFLSLYCKAFKAFP